MEPNQDKNPEKRSVRFIEGKGFYIALVLCAAVIGRLCVVTAGRYEDYG